MFVKKLVEKASSKKGGAGVVGLKAEAVNPRLAFHYGFPSGAASLAYDALHGILAVATDDGRIKLFGKDNTQALLQSEEAIPSKFLQFSENQGALINITIKNHIEVWDVERKKLCCIQNVKEEITSFALMNQNVYMYIGDSLGNVVVLMFDQESCTLRRMQYRIPFAESRGLQPEAVADTAVLYTLPQPMAETKRVLIIFRDGHISLWSIGDSKVIFTTGGSAHGSSHNEPKKVVSACWACSIGSKVVVGYNTGDILLWAIPVISDPRALPTDNKKESNPASNVPLLKLNLGYKMEKVPIISLNWIAGDSKGSHLYVNGYSDSGSFHSFQVILLNESSESRLVKLTLPLTESCLAMQMISILDDKNKKQNVLVLLLKSGHLVIFNEANIEHYLLKFHSKSPPSPPNEMRVKIPFIDSSITVAKVYTGNISSLSSANEEQLLVGNKYFNLLSVDLKEKDGNNLNSPRFSGFSKTKCLYITGHVDGVINFWDASCPLLLRVLTIKPQGDASNTSSGSPITALYFDVSSQILVSGDRNGQADIVTFKKEQSASDNIFSFLQGKQGGNYSVRTVKLNGAIQSISLNPDSKHLAIGTSKGYVCLVEMEVANIIYQKQLPSPNQLTVGVFSLNFAKYDQYGSEKYILLVGMEDSSVWTLEEDTGNALSTSPVQPKKVSMALLMHRLDDTNESSKGPVTSDSLLLFCSDKAVRLYFLSSAIQGIKKVYYKKKLNGTCVYASMVFGPSSDVGIMLIFASGKIEIRSLTDLTLLKETSLRGLSLSSMKSQSTSSIALCASAEGELIAVNGDQEMFFFSALCQDDAYRQMEHLSQVYDKDFISEGLSSAAPAQKEKKKGIFGMVVKNKSKNNQEMDSTLPPPSSPGELLAIFSTANFPLDDESNCSTSKNEDVELNIDDIDLDDKKDKPKGLNFAALNKQVLGKTFHAIKGTMGKLNAKTDEGMSAGKEQHEDAKAAGAVDQIKKRYGYGVSSDETVAKLAENKLHENVRKLKGIEERTTQMQGSAQSFSSMAKDLLKTAHHRSS